MDALSYIIDALLDTPDETRQYKEKLSATLEDFLRQSRREEIMTPQESAKAILDSLIEVVLDDRRANGILITEDGHFITAKHCIDGEDNKNHAHITLRTGASYPLDLLPTGARYVSMRQQDIAIGKARLPGPCRPKKYMIYDRDEIKHIPVALVSLHQGILSLKCGMIYRDSVETHTMNDAGSFDIYGQQFATTIKTVRGDSGSPIVSYDGRLMGIHHGADSSGTITADVRITQAFGLIEYYRKRLRE